MQNAILTFMCVFVLEKIPRTLRPRGLGAGAEDPPQQQQQQQQQQRELIASELLLPEGRKENMCGPLGWSCNGIIESLSDSVLKRPNGMVPPT